MKSMSTIATGANPKGFLLKTLRQIRRATYISTRMLGDVNAIASGVSRTINRWVKNRLIPGGSALTTFSVAVNRSRCGLDGQTTEETDWFRVVCWNNLAEVADRYLKKGVRVYVEGRLQIRKYVATGGEQWRSSLVTC
jgi:single-stranded DNA-binding protein